MTNVYAWPPVGAVGSEWTESAPVSSSRSIVTGASIKSATQRVRRLASLNVSALSGGRMGAGYCEMLKRLLAGGEHLVRLYSYPINWHLDAAAGRSLRQSVPLNWTSGGVDLNWTSGGVDLLWYSGTIITATLTTDGGFPALSITGAPANTLIARPGEFVTVYLDETDTEGETVQVLTEATTDGAGAAIVRLFSAPTHGGRASFGTSDTGVFEVVGALPRSMQTTRGDWTYSWAFREVFSDEVPGGFTEIDPWT